MHFFTTNPTVIADGGAYLKASAVTLAAYPILFITVFMMQGLKRPAYGLWIGIYRQIVAPIIVLHLLVVTFGWGLPGVWWGFSIVTWSAALFALWWGWRTTALQIAIQPLTC
jgi:Na+-driven multidrug efflux pump